MKTPEPSKENPSAPNSANSTTPGRLPKRVNTVRSDVLAVIDEARPGGQGSSQGAMVLAARHEASAPTMSSLEMVGLINSQRGESEATLAHSDFLKKVPQVLGEVAGNFSSYYVAGNGKQNPCYRFPRREACLMAMSYSYDLQSKVFDRMTALEAKHAAPVTAVPQTLAQALRLAADQADEIERHQEQIAIAAPKVAALELISASPGTRTITQAAKEFGMKRADLTEWMRASGWIYRQNGSWVAYDRFIKNGCLEYKEGGYTYGDDGHEGFRPYCHIKAKGFARLAEELNRKAA